MEGFKWFMFYSLIVEQVVGTPQERRGIALLERAEMEEKTDTARIERAAELLKTWLFDEPNTVRWEWLCGAEQNALRPVTEETLAWHPIMRRYLLIFRRFAGGNDD